MMMGLSLIVPEKESETRRTESERSPTLTQGLVMSKVKVRRDGHEDVELRSVSRSVGRLSISRCERWYRAFTAVPPLVRLPCAEPNGLSGISV